MAVLPLASPFTLRSTFLPLQKNLPSTPTPHLMLTSSVDSTRFAARGCEGRSCEGHIVPLFALHFLSTTTFPLPSSSFLFFEPNLLPGPSSHTNLEREPSTPY